MNNARDVLTYMLAGRAVITARSTKTNEHYTFKITRADDDQKRLFFVGVLAVPETYRYVGVIDDSGAFKLTRKSCYSADATCVRAFNYVHAHLRRGAMPPHAELRHAGTCGRCGRELTTPESIELGIGPICFEAMQK